MNTHRVKKSMDLLKGKRIEKVLVLNHLIFITFSDKSLFHIDITPGSQVDIFLSEKETDPINNDDLVYSTF